MDLNYLLNICSTQFVMQSGTLLYSLVPVFTTLSIYTEGTVGMLCAGVFKWLSTGRTFIDTTK